MENSLEKRQNYVALFVDWDNLAISTAADMAGATPDLSKIVQRARQYGTILVAKAYSEWTVTSERLAVYRAGVEPVYAPTFRFEPDPSAPSVRSKSLADPCIVADCIDTLHLLPMMSVMVLVSGDKDLVPVVRLSQLRGKQVVVIGPDFVASILREMANEFISYRSLVEEPEVHPPVPRERRPARPAAPETLGEPIAESRREWARAPARPLEGAPAPPPPAPQLRRRPQVLARPHQPPPSVQVEPAVTAPIPEPVAKPEPLREPAPSAADLQRVFAIIVDLVRQRTGEGKQPKVRATAIKDGLIQALPAFSERNYGFIKFKDLLEAAGKAGLVEVSRMGPVHWVSLAAKPEEKPSPLPTAAAAPETAEVDTSEARVREMIAFMRELRSRSRWLTYTYVLTNLVSHFAQTGSPATAEAQARAILNHLVQEGMLRVDAEPREIEVNGAKHRIRMCSLVETHPLVAEVLQSLEPAPGAPEETAPIESKEVSEPPAASLAAEVAAVSAPEQPDGRDRQSLVPTEEPLPAESAATPSDTAGPQAPEAERQTGPEQPTPVPVERAFAALAELVRAGTTERRPRLRAQGLKQRLIKTLGDFDERRYGFSRFRDFLLAAAQAAGLVVDTEGTVVWVSPAEAR